MNKMKFQYENNKRVFLLIYDISDNSKRTKFSKLLDGYGIRVQKSAYEINLDRRQRADLTKQTGQYVEAGDSIRMYPLDNVENTEIWGENQESVEDYDVFIA